MLIFAAQEEAVPESLKNILLVMADSGYLAPPAEKPEQRELWDQTWKRLDRFLPSLHGELFPEDTNAKGQKPPPRKSQEVPPKSSPKHKENTKAAPAEEKEAGKS